MTIFFLILLAISMVFMMVYSYKIKFNGDNGTEINFKNRLSKIAIVACFSLLCVSGIHDIISGNSSNDQAKNVSSKQKKEDKKQDTKEPSQKEKENQKKSKEQEQKQKDEEGAMEANFMAYEMIIKDLPSHSNNIVTDAYINKNFGTDIIMSSEVNSYGNQKESIIKQVFDIAQQAERKYEPMPDKYAAVKDIVIRDTNGYELARTSFFGHKFKYLG